MHKRTHRLKSMNPAEIARVVASTPSKSEAARRLQVDRSTLHRWLAAGKVSTRANLQNPPAAGAGRDDAAPQDAATWAEWVRQAYELNRTELELLTLAESALALSADATARPADRLAAMSRFQALVRQLSLEEDTHGTTQTNPNVRPFPSRVG